MSLLPEERVTLNDDVGGNVVAVGGIIDLAGNVSTNAVLQGGAVNIRKSAIIGKDATISRRVSTERRDGFGHPVSSEPVGGKHGTCRNVRSKIRSISGINFRYGSFPWLQSC